MYISVARDHACLLTTFDANQLFDLDANFWSFRRCMSLGNQLTLRSLLQKNNKDVSFVSN